METLNAFVKNVEIFSRFLDRCTRIFLCIFDTFPSN